MNKKILAECLRIAQENNTPEKHPEYGNFHHFAFIVQNNKIIEWDTNKSCNQHVKGKGRKAHAEKEAYKKGRSLLGRKSFECVNVRLNKDGSLRMSAPCERCYRFLSIYGCTKVWFTTEIGFASIKI